MTIIYVIIMNIEVSLNIAQSMKIILPAINRASIVLISSTLEMINYVCVCVCTLSVYVIRLKRKYDF